MAEKELKLMSGWVAFVIALFGLAMIVGQLSSQ